MKIVTPGNKTLLLSAGFYMVILFPTPQSVSGQTEITKWPHGKTGAVSITYDDGSINQFHKALPIMNRLNLPGTFFINTGVIPGSQFQGKFIGRPVNEIIENSAVTPTDKENFYERASAAGYLGYEGGLEYHSRAGSRFDSGHPEEACRIIDELYEKVRNGELPVQDKQRYVLLETEVPDWDEIRVYASQGHEFASHMVTHPRMAALDEKNMLYELEKSREEILNQLGVKHTFSAECPYGTENERVMKYAHEIYPALRNRMPEPFMEELNRSNKKDPGSFSKEYVQWQRGATTKTPLPMMKSWIDTTASGDNIWLVLVFHGVDGIGWEALTSELLDEYFRYINSYNDLLWVATFGDATKYIRERMNSIVNTSENDGKIIISLSNSLDKSIYDLPLTLKTYLPAECQEIKVRQGDEIKHISVHQDSGGRYALYQAYPDAGDIILSEF